MADYDDALIEKVAAAIYDNATEPTGVKARAVLDAVADDLRAEVAERIAQAIEAAPLATADGYARTAWCIRANAARIAREEADRG